MTIDGYAVSVLLMAIALVVALAAPVIGLWALLALLLQGPIGRLVANVRSR